MTEVRICEMSPRDGLQFFGVSIPDQVHLIQVDKKLELIRTLEQSGLGYIEVGSFVNPTRTPQMGNTDELAKRLRQTRPASGIQYAALVPNIKGYRRFKDCELDVVALFPSACEHHSKANFGAPIDEVLAWAEEVAQAAQRDKKALRGHVSAAFQNIHYGHRDSDLETVIRVCQRLFNLGCEYLTLADTNGETTPRRVSEVLEGVGNVFGGLKNIGVHLHDRNGAGLCNALAAYNAGVRIFDSSVGGIGGSYAASKLRAGAKGNIAGNIATEQLVDLFNKLGVETHVNLEALYRAGKIIYEITQITGDFAPPSMLIREQLGYGIVWANEPPQHKECFITKEKAA